MNSSFQMAVSRGGLGHLCFDANSTPLLWNREGKVDLPDYAARETLGFMNGNF
jgi:hypothetical protein